MAHIIILAAGKGTRMRSELPKVLHPVGGVPMIGRALRAAEKICARPSIVVGHRASDVIHALGPDHAYVLQMEQRGTGHAVHCALLERDVSDESVFVMPGDHPFVTAATIRRIVAAREARDAAIALATLKLPDFEGERAQFSGCGRIIRGVRGTVVGIVERREADAAQARIREVNVSYYCFRGSWLKENLSRIVSDGTADEYYLTDLVAAAAAQSERIADVALSGIREGMGVNTPEQLAAVAV